MPIQKFDKPNKTVQCIRLLKILKAKQYVKKAEIARLLGEETTRNINNYKNTLYDAGYPIHYLSGRYGGYYLESDGMLPGNRLSDEGLKALGTAYGYLEKEVNVPHKRVLLDYLGNAFLQQERANKGEELALFGHFPLSMPLEDLEKRYYLIQTAIDAKCKVRVLYRGYNNDHYRVIHPYKLFKFTNWIVLAYDESAANRVNTKFNRFKLHRMLEIDLLEEPFQVDPSYVETDFFDKSGLAEEQIHVKLIIRGRMGRHLDEKVYGQNQVVTCLDPQRHVYQFEADMRNQLVVRKFILSFGSRCEVIAPTEIRQEMILDAKRLLYQYGVAAEFTQKDEKKLKFYFSGHSLCNKEDYDGVTNKEMRGDIMKVKGQFSEAVIYTDMIEESAMKQVQEICDVEAFAGAKIRIMPDVHSGKGCVIGFTANLGQKVIPNIVGVDIGCGMYTVKLGQVELDLEGLDKFIHQHIPNGSAINEHKRVDFMAELETLKLLNDSRQDLKKWNRAIGSLGGGNHFIEINVDDDGNKYLVIHSGSRNLGHVVATHYQKAAIAYHSGFNETYLKERLDLIEAYKQGGKRDQIQSAIADLKASHAVALKLPDHMCYLEGDLRDSYLHDMVICQRFAELNRETIANRILEYAFGHSNFVAFHTTHNFIDFEDNIVRKGAIKASKSTEVLIPINMRDGSILAVGKGNPDWNYSAPHGAGRLMSRTKAFESIDFKDFEEEMKGIYSTSITPKTLDESPMAYKSIGDILNNIGDTVEVVAVLKPIYNFKAQD